MPVRPNAVRRRQYLLLGGLLATIGAGALLSVYLGGGHTDRAPVRKPVTTRILAPGAQVDPKDAWRGQADAQLKAIEQKSREITERHSQLDSRSEDMLERLKRLEQAGVHLPPPPPVPGPVIKPEFGPDRRTDAPARDPLLQRLPPPPMPGTVPPPSTPPAVPGIGQPLQPHGIVSLTLVDPTVTKGSPADSATAVVRRSTHRYLPGGSFARALLLGGLDAPTGGQAQRNPQPVLLKLLDNAILPNRFRSQVKDCFVVGAGYGDVSAERAYIRTESLSCVTTDGHAIDVPLKGYVAGEDGKAGMRGRLVTKQGQLLANALVSGIASGIGHAFQQNATTLSVSPLGSTSSVDPERQFQAGVGSGVGKALDRLAQYYIALAEKVFPVIEVDAGRSVDVVLTQGLALSEELATHTTPDDDREEPASGPSDSHPQTRPLEETQDDEQ